MYNIHTLLDLSLAPTRYKENSKLYPFNKKHILILLLMKNDPLNIWGLSMKVAALLSLTPRPLLTLLSEQNIPI